MKTHQKTVRQIRSFNRFYTNIIGVVDGHILKSPYSLTEVRILHEVYFNQALTAREILSVLHVDEGYLSRTMSKLVREGLVARKQSAKDGRELILSLSRKGEKIFLELNDRQNDTVDYMIRHLSARECALLTSMMKEIRNLLEEKR